MIDGDLVTIREHIRRPVDGQKSKDAVSHNIMHRISIKYFNLTSCRFKI